jgi:hypothetical protein
MPLDDINGVQGNGLPADSDGNVFREVNDRIREVAGGFGDDEAGIFVCECDDGDCIASISMSLDEYDRLRLLNPSAPLLANRHPARKSEKPSEAQGALAGHPRASLREADATDA